MESVVAFIDVLLFICEVVGEEVEVIYDGGIMCGVDVVKVFVFGVNVVGVGKVYLYGFVAGEGAGVNKAFEIFTSEMKCVMGLFGVKDVYELCVCGFDLVCR